MWESSSAPLVQRRVGKLKGSDDWRALDDVRQCLEQLGVGRSFIRFRVLSGLPQAYGYDFRPSRYNEQHFVLETLLLAKRWNDRLLEQLDECRTRVWLELQRQDARNHAVSVDERRTGRHPRDAL